MSFVVIDSCVAAKLVLQEADSQQAEQLAIGVAARGDQLAVLDIGLVECGNIIWKHYRAKRISSSEALAALEALQKSQFAVHRSDNLMAKSLELAMRYDKHSTIRSSSPWSINYKLMA